MKYITVGCIFLFLGVLAWVNQERVCINSNLIGKIHIETSYGNKVIPSCDSDFRSQSLILGTLKKRIDRFNRSLAEFQVFKSAFDPSLYDRSKEIRVSLQQPQVFKEEGRVITIGIDLFETKGFLKHLVARMWLQNLNPALGQNDFHLDILSSALSHAIWGDVEFRNPLTQKNWDISKSMPWVKHLVSEQSLCQKSWRPLGVSSYCSLIDNHQVSQKFESLQSLSLWSFKPIFLNDFYKRYSNLGITDRIHFLTSWMEKLTLLKHHDFSMDSEGGLQKHYAQLWQPLLGSYFSTPELAIDLLVDLDQPVDQDRIADLQPFATRQNIVFKSGNVIQALGSSDSVNLAYYKLNAQKRVWVGCGEPQLLSVYFKKSISNRLLYIHSCEPEEGLNLSLYLKGDIQLFAKHSHAQNFILFHLPSIQLARKIWNVDLKQNVAISSQRPDGFNKLKNLFGWKKSNRNRLTKMAGALPIVEWFQSSKGQYLELIDNKM